MAEGIEINFSALAKSYFCHQCALDICITPPELKCPHCNGTFVEELTLDSDEGSDVDIETVSSLTQVSLNDLIRRTIRRTVAEELGFFAGSSPIAQWLQDRDPLHGDRPQRMEDSYLEGSLDEEGPGVIEQIFQMATNMRDYAIGGEWDSIITQLLNEAEVTGPPPLPNEKIDEIPVIAVNKEHVEKGVQCTVCMEDFVLGEEVKKLPCDHFFHKDCIVPWLKMHATCPICRKEIEGESESSSSSQMQPRDDSLGENSRTQWSSNPGWHYS